MIMKHRQHRTCRKRNDGSCNKHGKPPETHHIFAESPGDNIGIHHQFRLKSGTVQIFPERRQPQYQRRRYPERVLSTEIADRFDVQIPAEEILPENFDSAEALWALITRLDEE